MGLTPLGRVTRWGSCFSRKSVPAQALARGWSPADLSWSRGFSGSLDCSCPLETYGPTGALSPLHVGGLRTPCDTPACGWGHLFWSAYGSALLAEMWWWGGCSNRVEWEGLDGAPTRLIQRANKVRTLEVEMLDLRRTTQAHLGGKETEWVSQLPSPSPREWFQDPGQKPRWSAMDPSVLELVCELGQFGAASLGSGCQREESCSEELPCPWRVFLKCLLRND